ncbi:MULTISPECIES: type VII secretion-associated protein [unclassified Rhodococcus (in: high G+C Gram-positive bacteria)]|uniref:type VII secretion-associated protein n=1 Tax=unclassified Rhodococcus (in: high G+C Gram-positive bacteria) TaxID=192944 RepID=UPI00163A44AB|nr:MULTISPECIES: type VII secretion-associated protein [unclassified Rhodococcus (in: high G+C Gram-positive bacteria)]MBC2643385.1 type VII secretion-associated protein [Rhodococcus sp. 3A]MBC2891875.1 type VII secretion-associated protein [Rhodococcus sp. 4CII]
MDAPAVTSSVAIHLTESGIWSCAQGVTTAIREMTPLYFVDDEYIDVDGGVLAVSDALTAVLRSAIGVDGESAPIATAVLSCPSEWGSARRSVLSDAGARVAAGVVLVPVAVAAAESIATPAGRWLVVESRTVGATASYVVGEVGGYRVAECEHDSSVCADEGIEKWGAAVAELVIRARGDRRVDGILLTGIDDSREVPSMRDAVAASVEPAADIRVVTGEEIARALASGLPEAVGAPPVMAVPQANWLEPALQRSEQDGRRHVRPTLFAVAAVLAVVVGAVLVFTLRGPDSGAESVRALDASAVPVAAPTPTTTFGLPRTTTTTTTATAAAGTDLEVGGLRVTLPGGWTQRVNGASAPSGARVELVPSGGADRRIIITQNAVREGAGYDEVAATLAAKIAQRGRPGLFRELERDVVFGGRPGISYSEFPDESSAVRWHVLIERDLQVSVGCQFLTEEWESIESACEEVVRSLVIVR